MASQPFRYPYDIQSTLEPWRHQLGHDFDDVVAHLADRDRSLEDYVDRVIYDRINSLVTFGGGETIGLGAWTTYTPALTATTTNPTLGVGAVTQGRWQRAGRVIVCQFYIKFGSSGTNQGIGVYRVSLPVTAATIVSAPTRTSSFPTGIGWGFNAAANLTYAGVELVGAGAGGAVDRVELRPVTNPTVITAFTDAVPFTWGANMEITGTLTYEAVS